MKNQILAILLVAGSAAPAVAQTSDVVLARQESADRKAAEETAVYERQVKIVGATRERKPVESRTTVGVPYSAEAVTESTQTLADGNRINQKVTTRIYRDGEGRTRRDQLNEGGAVESTFIVDPAAGTSYVFEQSAQGVNESMTGMDPAKIATREGASGAVAFRGNVRLFTGSDVFFENGPESKAKAEALDQAKIATGKMERLFTKERAAEGQTVREDLGTSTIEGLAATGTRTTTTIAAGAIGNLQPIKVVSEEWFSPDLQVLVLTKHNDPRSGETIYRLLNVVRAEPDPSLFVAPAEDAAGKPGMRFRQERSR